MRLWVGVTDRAWYRHLRSRPGLDEANFWQPGGGRRFGVLQPGEPFLFKLHAPDNFIVGGGFFTHWTALPASLAWEAFGEGNGAGSYLAMRAQIESYRRLPAQPGEDYSIGCIILQRLFFLDEAEWIPVPPDFARNIVQGKGYDTRTPAGASLWERVRHFLAGHPIVGEADRERPMYGSPALVRQRLGQGTFRVLITDAYERRCAVTQEKTLPVLQAAHILPVSEGGVHRLDNGVLLRSDIHTLFDRGYVTITPDHRFRVSRRLKLDYDNGRHYYALEDSPVRLPPRVEDRPSREYLERHADVIFKG